jgi:hypothetical protein
MKEILQIICENTKHETHIREKLQIHELTEYGNDCDYGKSCDSSVSIEIRLRAALYLGVSEF